MRYLIVESPTKSKKIQSMLGRDWKVLASFGHVRDLPAKTLGVDRRSFQPEYEVPPKSRKTVARLRKEIPRDGDVYLATDPDREGEAIAWHLRDLLKLRNPRRVRFHAITKDAIQAAIGNPDAIDMNLVQAQEARRILDRLYGYLVSPALSRSLNNRLSAGRVQSPALKLVVAREREIRNFKPIRHYGVRLFFVSDQDPESSWHADWSVKDWMGEDADPYCTDRALAERIAGIETVEVTECRTDEKRTKAPAPFTTSALQQAASRVLGLKVKQVMELAQRLFEGGHITYHRTDSRNLDPEAIESIRAWLTEHGHPIPDRPNTWKSGANAQEAHEAIRPTRIEADRAGESPEEQALYELIRRRALACQMPPAIHKRVRLTLRGTPQGLDRQAVFRATGLTLSEAGWTRIESPPEPTEGDDEAEASRNRVPKLEAGRQASPVQGIVQEKQTRPPARYTEASLVKQMEKLGIGRPSTYAQIIETNTRRGYWKAGKGGKLEPTELGEQVVDWLDGRFRFMDLAFTRDLEQQLDDIAAGRARQRPLLEATLDMIERELAALGLGADALQNQGGQDSAEAGPPCPVCGKPLHRRNGRKGPFWGCSGYPKCRYTTDDDNGRPAPKDTATGTSDGNGNQPRDRKDANKARAGDPCPTCGQGSLVQRTFAKGRNAGKSFIGCSRFPECRHFSWP